MRSYSELTLKQTINVFDKLLKEILDMDGTYTCITDMKSRKLSLELSNKEIYKLEILYRQKVWPGKACQRVPKHHLQEIIEEMVTEIELNPHVSSVKICDKDNVYYLFK